MSQHQDFRVIAAALVLAIGFYIHYRNKWLQKNRRDEEIEGFTIPRLTGSPRFEDPPRPNDPKTKRFDTWVFVIIVAIAVTGYIMDPRGCTPR